MKSFIGHILSFLSLFFLSIQLHAQLNMTLQDSMDYNVGVNDVCGWVAPDGREYALVGLNSGVSIVDINSDTIHQVAFVPGVDNLWRDINTFGHYAYVSSEAHIGLLIINLEHLPDSVESHVWFGVCHRPSGDETFQKAHSLQIDENGILFLNGSNLNSGGCILVDVKTDPENPICLGYAPAVYSHDCIARDSILYSAEIYAGNASIYDFHDISNITLLGQVKTPHEFTHNISLSEDGHYMFTTDERPNSYMTAYDISDKSNIKETDRFRQAAVEGSGAIVHNTFTWNDWQVLAYYSSGTLIVDASRPKNLIEVGNFDSFIGANGGYEGVWGAYVDLPSHKILASDRSNGLFVFIPNYVHAAFLEGTVIDSITGLPIAGATVKINSDEIVLPQTTILDGTFKTGKAVPGIFPIVTSKEGYYSKTLLANFINGEVLTPVIKLKLRPKYNFSGRVINAQNGGIPFAKVTIFGEGGTYNVTADANGDFLMPEVYEGEYEVQAGIWGETVESELSLNGSQSLTLQVERGYKDDFDLDLGWTISGEATIGQWARGVPTQQKLFDLWECGSATDSPYDMGSHVYSTGLAPISNVANDEVGLGSTILTSPVMHLDTFLLPQVSFDYWLCEFPPNQFFGFKVWVTDGIDTTLFRQFTADTTVGIGYWDRFKAPLILPGTGKDIQLIFTATDTAAAPDDYHLKVHVDNFKVEDQATGVHDVWTQSGHFIIYPNPNHGDALYLKAENGIKGTHLFMKICDAEGRVVSSYNLSKNDAENGIQYALDEGFYFLQWNTEKGESGTEKILVIH